MLLAQLSAGFPSLPPPYKSKLGPSVADSRVGGFVYILAPCGSLQQTLLWGWESLPLPQPPRNFSLRFWGFCFPCWIPRLHGLSHSLVVPHNLSSCECGTTWSVSHCLISHLLHPSLPSSPLLPIWINVSSLTPWLSDFHTVQFSGSSGWFCF